MAWGLAVLGCSSSQAPTDAGAHDVAARDLGPDAGCSLSAAESVLTMHGDPGRTGLFAASHALSAEAIAARGLALRWRTDPLDRAEINGRSYAAQLYASPLYVDDLRLSAGPFAGRTVGAVIAATSNGWVYAIYAGWRQCGRATLAPGTILWRTQVATPGITRSDGGVPMGVLSTPVIARDARGATLYVSAMDAARGWLVSAIDLETGRVKPGWPLAITPETLAGVTANGPARFASAPEMSQRGALALSPDHSRLYIAFGTYAWAGPGWLVAVDTARAAIARAFAGAPSTQATSNAGMWSSNGPAVAPDGTVLITTGNSPADSLESPGVWGNSLLAFDPQLGLRGAYTPFNYCLLDAHNIDLGGAGVSLLPAASTGRGSTPSLAVFGGKQGVVYLVDRAALMAAERPPTQRPGCLTARRDAAQDRSLFSSAVQPAYGAPGPLVVFGEYTDDNAQVDHARMRSTPAYFRDDAGREFLYVTGAARAPASDPTPRAPSLVRLALNAPENGRAALERSGQNPETVLINPGSPIVSAHGSHGPVVWVLDAALPRSAPLVRDDGTTVPGPVLRAFDGESMALLWASPPGLFGVGGKYNEPIVAHDTVYVGADRVYAFGVPESASVDAGLADDVPHSHCANFTGYSEHFDALAAGAALPLGWDAEGTSARGLVRLNTDDEGFGAAGSRRWAIALNNAVSGRALLTMSTPAFDLSGCAEARFRVDAIAFSMERGELDRAWLELRSAGTPWQRVIDLYPSMSFTENVTCRPGLQSTGCTAWHTFEVAVPGAMLEPGVRLRMVSDTLTSHSDAMGLDAVRLDAQ